LQFESKKQNKDKYMNIAGQHQTPTHRTVDPVLLSKCAISENAIMHFARWMLGVP
jgi:hypothetical protein